MKNIVIAVLIALVGALGYFAFVRTPAPAEQAMAPQGKRMPYVWTFTEIEADQYGMAQTSVRVSSGGKSYDLGKYAGSCHEVAAGEKGVLNDDADPGEVSRVQCWFAGGGDEIGIFEDGPKAVVKVGELGEGTAEEPAFRGNFKTLLEL